MSASIYSLAAEEIVRAERAAWSRFASARDRNEFCLGWLAILCTQVDRVRGAVVLLGPDADGAYVPAAIWPEPTRDMRHLGATAERALGERRGIVTAADGQSAPTRDHPAHVGYPIEVAGTLHGAVVLEIAPGPEIGLQKALRLLHWASVWLVDWFRKDLQAESERRIGRLSETMDLLATAMQEHRLAAAALAVVNQLAAKQKCDRVSIGLEATDDVDVIAISNTAIFDSRMSMVRHIAAAMEEVLDLDAAVVWPPPAGDELGAVSHAELATEYRDVAICSVPILEDGRPVGVLTLERGTGQPFDDDAIEFCKTAASLLGPLLSLKRENERGVFRRLREAIYDRAWMLFGPRHPGVKLVALVVVCVVAFLSLATGTYRVAARTVVEGSVQRAAVAPFDGHIAQSFVRAGDVVQAGQVLCRLDDRDLKLERERLVSEREQAQRRGRLALAAQDRGAMMVADAQVQQANAEIGLIDDKLARATLTAPFAGVIVSGDLNQLLGTPVEQGKLLFQIAPLDSYRVILEVDERDIASVHVDQPGDLTLSGMPDRQLAFSVQQITPVASQADGRNFFRVEAHLTAPPGGVRPGMEGLGKIEVGERHLLWIWTHSLVDWLRFWAWRQLP